MCLHAKNTFYSLGFDLGAWRVRQRYYADMEIDLPDAYARVGAWSECIIEVLKTLHGRSALIQSTATNKQSNTVVISPRMVATRSPHYIRIWDMGSGRTTGNVANVTL
jgi:hypothetical protein